MVKSLSINESKLSLNVIEYLGFCIKGNSVIPIDRKLSNTYYDNTGFTKVDY